MSVLPQEIQIWYVLPALRRELAIVLIRKHCMSQKKVAGIFGISEAAVSQYLSSKRGIKVKFDPDVMREIGVSGKRISLDNSSSMKELMRLSGLNGIKRTMCTIHISRDPSLKGCNICFGGFK